MFDNTAVALYALYDTAYRGAEMVSPAKPVSIRITPDTRKAIEETCRRTGRDFSSVANEMLAESVKMRRIPGIVFGDSPVGRVARLAGTGIAVFEVIKAYREMEQDLERLRSAYHWLSDLQLRAALAYAEAYPEEVQARIALDEEWAPERAWEAYPFTKPNRARQLRFYLDEDLSQRTAELGRQRGLDIVSSHECGRDGLSDEDQLRLAGAEGRTLVTRNYADFTLLTHRFWEMTWPHAGVLFVGPGLPNDHFSDIAEALLRYDQESHGGLLPYQVDYLKQL